MSAGRAQVGSWWDIVIKCTVVRTSQCKGNGRSVFEWRCFYIQDGVSDLKIQFLGVNPNLSMGHVITVLTERETERRRDFGEFKPSRTGERSSDLYLESQYPKAPPSCHKKQLQGV